MKQVLIMYTALYSTELSNYQSIWQKGTDTLVFLNQLANSFGSTSHLSLINYTKTLSLRSELFKM